MLDIITVVFRDEIPVLKLQAKSIELYCPEEDLGRIYVIVNDDRMDVKELNLDWWGKYKDRVTVVHRTAWQLEYDANGWLTQQLLKLLATDICTSEWSLVLDAKTLFVKPMPKFETRPQVGVLDIGAVFEPSRQIVNNLFGIDLKKQLGPGGVPFMFNNTLAKEMMAEISTMTGRAFGPWFQEQGMLTEFILYAGYVVYRFGTLDSIYNTKENVIHPCNLCHSEVPSFDRKFAEMPKAGTVSIHRNAWKQLSEAQQAQYTDFLKSRGIE